MTMRETIRAVVEREARRIGGEDLPPFTVEVPEDANHGDYASNMALVLGKLLKRQPMELAEELAEKLADKRWEVSVEKPGFLNFKIADSFLFEESTHVAGNLRTWGTSTIGKGKTVIVEYFQLNIAKRPHIGHLRSAVIGDALKRLLLASGYNTISDTHVGDWGTQFGILLYAYKQVDWSMTGYFDVDPFQRYEMLYSFYNQAQDNVEIRNRLIEQHWGTDKTDWERIHERGKEEFAKLEAGDEENRKIWQHMRDVSMKELVGMAGRLTLEKFDEHKGEQSYEADMPSIVEQALQKGVAMKKNDGAVVVDLASEKLDEAVLVKSDGASTYFLRDLATIKYRREKWNFWKNLYVVDVRQSHHFRQVFRVAELLGFEGVGESEHIEFGFMKLPEGAISTRKGTAIPLELVLNESIDRARKVIQEKNPGLKSVAEVAVMVGVGAIKYFDLSHNRKSDVVFDWDKALSFEGNTGPYLQYTHARFSSILRKVGTERTPFEFPGLEEGERRLLIELLRFPEAIQDSLALWSPHVLAGYLYNLAGIANEFYHVHPVVQEHDKQKKQLRIQLVVLTMDTLKKGLNLLGIEAPEEM